MFQRDIFPFPWWLLFIACGRYAGDAGNNSHGAGRSFCIAASRAGFRVWDMNDAKQDQEPWVKFYKRTSDGRWLRKSRTGSYAAIKSARVLKRLTVLPATRLRKAD